MPVDRSPDIGHDVPPNGTVSVDMAWQVVLAHREGLEAEIARLMAENANLRIFVEGGTKNTDEWKLR